MYIVPSSIGQSLQESFKASILFYMFFFRPTLASLFSPFFYTYFRVPRVHHMIV